MNSANFMMREMNHKLWVIGAIKSDACYVKQITHQLFIVYSWLFLADREFVKIKVGFEKIIWFDGLWHFPQSAERSKKPTTKKKLKKLPTYPDCFNSWEWRHKCDVIGVKMATSNKSDIYTLRLTNKFFSLKIWNKRF